MMIALYVIILRSGTYYIDYLVYYLVANPFGIVTAFK